jgi:Carboxypeptidase regulatory-like domain
MDRHRHTSLFMILLIALVLTGFNSAYAQLRIVGSISGTVQDPNGAVVPNAKVVLKDQTTGLTKETTTSDGGTFLFPDLASGTYSVTVSVAGFKTELIPNVSVTTSKTTDVRIALEVGQTNETVTITADTGYVLETSSQLIVNTLNSKAVTELPLGSRSNTLALARLAQGAQPPTGGDTRYNNLPGGAVNVTVDGINNASNGFKSGGTVFFVTVPVRTGAVDEISVETGGMTAESGAQSGANIKFTTKRGGEKYHGSFFYEPQSERFNSNTWSRNAQNLPRLFNRTQNYGGNAGGPLIPFGSFKKKAFFFINYERAYSPVRNARTITVLTADAQKGNFTYLVSGTTNTLRTANVFTLAAAKGLPTTIDPVAKSIIDVNNKIPLQAQKISSGNDFNHDTYTWPAENNNFAYFPAARFDVFVTKKQQFTWTWNYRHNWQAGEKRMPVDEVSRTNPFRLGYFIWSAALQSTFSPRVFNEIRYGVQHSGDSNASAAYGNYFTVNGVPLRIGGTLPFGPTVPFIDQANVTGRHTIDTLYDTLTWTRGEHTFTFGGSYRNTVWNDTQVIFAVPSYATGTPSGDPLSASSAFTTTTLPGINSTELGNPLALYNTLTGRVASSSFTKVVNPETLAYDGGNSINYTFTASHMGGAYVQDKWRFSKDLTLSFGLRWEVQGAMHDTKGLTAVPDLASIYGPSKGLFAPGVMSGNNNPTLQVGVTPYKTDWKNFAPNFGFAWNPNFEKGWLNKLTGGQKTVIRGYYGLVVYDEGTQFFAANLGPNIGKTINGTTLIPGTPGQTNLPAFYTLSNIVASPLTASNFAFATSTYAKTINQADQTFARTISGFDPTLRAPYTINWDFGIQRELWRNTVLEARYVGNQGHLLWRTSNLNEVNIFENGFLPEFKNAQSNLAINQAAGVNSFQNLGRAGQVNLPIFDAAFLARGALGPIAAASGYQSSGFITDLQNGAAGDLANTLATNQNYVCRMFGNTFSPCGRVQPLANVPGPYPINFFLLNPFVAGRLNFTDDTGWSSYNGLQVQFRQRLANGFNWSANWTWSKSMTNLPVDNQNQSVDFLTLRNFDTTRRESLFDIRHTIQVSGTYDLPFGRGKLLSFNNRILNGVFGGWTLGSILVANTGQPIQLTGGFATVNQSNNPGAGFNAGTGGVQLAPGVTLKQIQRLFNAPRIPLTSLGRAGASPTQFLAVSLGLIGPDGRANPAYIVPNRTPGSFGQILFIRDRNTFSLDNSINKEFRIMERMRLQLFAGFSNILNHPRWGIPDTNVFSTTFGVVNGPGYVSTAGGVGNYGRVMNLRATAIF